MSINTNSCWHQKTSQKIMNHTRKCFIVCVLNFLLTSFAVLMTSWVHLRVMTESTAAIFRRLKKRKAGCKIFQQNTSAKFVCFCRYGCSLGGRGSHIRSEFLWQWFGQKPVEISPQSRFECGSIVCSGRVFGHFDHDYYGSRRTHQMHPSGKTFAKKMARTWIFASRRSLLYTK